MNKLIASIKSENKLPLAIILILILSFLINIYGIWWGLPSWRGWAADEVTPGHVLEGISQGFSNGWYYTYPPFHFYVLTILYSPFLILLLILDKLNLVDITLFPVLFHQNTVDATLFPIYTILFYLGRFLSVLMGTATVFIVYLCGREIYDKKASIFAALIAALICPFIYYSKTTNIEVPYIFWFALSLLFYVRILKYHRIADYLLFSLTAVISICTKDQAYGFYILTPLFIVLSYYLYRKKQNKDITIANCLADRRIVLSLLLGVSLFFTFHNIFFNWNGFLTHLNYLVGPASHDSLEKAGNNILNLKYLGLFRRSLNYISPSLGLPIFIVCLLGLLSAVLQRKKNYLLLCLLIPGISYFIFFLGVIFYARIRFLIPLCIILAFFGGKFISDFLKSTAKSHRGKVVLIGLLFIYTFARSFSVDVLMAQDSRYHVEEWMKQNVAEKSSVLAVGSLRSLPRFEFQDLNLKKVNEKKDSRLTPSKAKNDYSFSSLSLSDLAREK